MKVLTLLMLFASFLARVTGQDTLELTVSRIAPFNNNVVVLRCRTSNGEIPGNPVFETTGSGTPLQGESDQTGLAGGELRVTITEHSTVLCRDNDAQSNTLRIPVFPSGPPPGEELYVFREDTEELKCNILNPPPEDFRDLYTLNGWIRVLQAGVQYLTLQSAPDRIDPETFALSVSVGEDIQDGDSYQCQVSIAFSSDSDSLRTYTASGAKITIRIAVPFQVTGDFPATVDSTLGELVNFTCSITGSNASAHWRVGNDNFTDCSNSVFCVNSQMISETLQETMLTIDTTGVPPDTPLGVECVGVQVLTDFNITRISRSTLFTVREIRLSVLGRTDNTVELRCRRQDDELLLNPVFTATVGPELQGPDVLEIGDIIINITEHSAIICNNGTGGQQSNTIYLPAFPTETPPSSEVHVLQGTIAELPCTIDPAPLDGVEFRNLYSIDQWVRVYQDPQNGIEKQSFTPESLPSGDHLGIADVTFSFFVRIGETIHSGDSYKCEFSIREWSSSLANAEMGNRVMFEGGNISIIAEAASSDTTTTATTVGITGILFILILMIAFGSGILYLVYKRKKGRRKTVNLKQHGNELQEQPAKGGGISSADTWEPDSGAMSAGQQQQPQEEQQHGGGGSTENEEEAEDESSSGKAAQALLKYQQAVKGSNSTEHSDRVQDAIEEDPPPDYDTAMSYPLAVMKTSRANSECNTVSELVQPEPPEAPQSRSLTLQPALNETQGSLTESLVHSGIPEKHPPLDYVTAMCHPTMKEDVHTATEGNIDHLSDRQVETELGATSIAILQSTDQSISAPTSPDFVCTKPDCPCQRDRCSHHNHLVSEIESQHKTHATHRQLATDEEMLDSSSHAQQKLTLARRVRIPVEESECNQHLHTNTSAHQLMEEDVMMYTTNEEGADTYPVSDRHAETAMSANLLQSAELSISAPTSSDFVCTKPDCTKPDCPCQRDRCNHYNHLVSEFESQHTTYADYATDEEMLDSSGHAQQKLTLAQRVRTPVEDSASNQSSQQINLQIIDKLNPSVHLMDGMDVIQCDSLGGHYYNSTCDFALEIPRGAVPEGTTVQIEVGASLYGPFQFPENARPISPIVWLCVRQPQREGFKFLKPIKVTLPHYLDLTDGGDKSLELGFLKADHSLNQNKKYQFEEVQDGKATFQPEYGVIHTNHCCYLCLKAGNTQHVDLQTFFCLHRIVPKPVTAAAWDIVFCVTYFSELCLKSVGQQYLQHGDKITSQRFKFTRQGDGSEPNLKIDFDPHPPGRWQLVLQTKSEITPTEVEFWTEKVDDMELMHKSKQYPPRFAIEVSGELAVRESYVKVTFTGVDDKYLESINTQISLVPVQMNPTAQSTEPMSASSRSSISSGFASPGSHSISGFHGFPPRVLGDGGGGGATDDTDIIHKQDRPKTTQLLWFPAADKRDVVNIIEKISANYSDFGTFLLKDDEGTKVPVIAEANHHKPVDITKAILRGWLAGEGMAPVTWKTLIECLRYSRLNSLVNVIEASLEP